MTRRKRREFSGDLFSSGARARNIVPEKRHARHKSLRLATAVTLREDLGRAPKRLSCVGTFLHHERKAPTAVCVCVPHVCCLHNSRLYADETKVLFR